MIIGVVADTHDNLNKVSKVIEVFKEKNIEIVLHAGDYIAPFTLKKFSELGVKLIGVFGNNDCEKPLLYKVASGLGYELYGQPVELVLDNRNILLLHGFGGKKFTRLFVDAAAATGEYDLVVYGHTHEKDCRVFKKNSRKTVILNPGEVCGLLSGRSTVAIVNLDTLEVEVVKV
ncbi:MAG: metallophosphoesterase [Thermoprotei archaeon]|nr:MAG: metallophosphoesterase [Thermoprotei archaeon]